MFGLIFMVDGNTDNYSYNICCNGQFWCKCDNDNFTLTNVNNIYFDGSYSFALSNISSIIGIITDSGGYSIQSSHIIDFNTLILLINGYYVGCFATESCDKSTFIKYIGVENIFATGSYSIAQSIIINDGIGTIVMNIYFLSYWSGFQTSIRCNQGDRCIIYVSNMLIV